MTTRPPSASIHCYRLVVVVETVVVVVVVVVVAANINMLYSYSFAFVVVSTITWRIKMLINTLLQASCC